MTPTATATTTASLQLALCTSVESPTFVRGRLEVPTGGYLMRFQYRVGTAKQNDESIRVSLGGKRFDFLYSELRDSGNFE